MRAFKYKPVRIDMRRGARPLTRRKIKRLRYECQDGPAIADFPKPMERDLLLERLREIGAPLYDQAYAAGAR